ncbi:hypothetical protein COO60DRAFT_1486250 [Scenedesmus sp. NREL 46B-D3]|nr:hypothetical protein COO60DRAFT_1486250 [Scenedesmus sp. NREL 46B-D3]
MLWVPFARVLWWPAVHTCAVLAPFCRLDMCVLFVCVLVCISVMLLHGFGSGCTSGAAGWQPSALRVLVLHAERVLGGVLAERGVSFVMLSATVQGLNLQKLLCMSGQRHPARNCHVHVNLWIAYSICSRCHVAAKFGKHTKDTVVQVTCIMQACLPGHVALVVSNHCQ